MENSTSMTTCKNQVFIPMQRGIFSDEKLLLEDEFDNELSSIDFDSLCRYSLTSGSHNQSGTVGTLKAELGSHAPKICSQQEIEEKRLAALNRLKMKKTT